MKVHRASMDRINSSMQSLTIANLRSHDSGITGKKASPTPSEALGGTRTPPSSLVQPQRWLYLQRLSKERKRRKKRAGESAVLQKRRRLANVVSVSYEASVPPDKRSLRSISKRKSEHQAHALQKMEFAGPEGRPMKDYLFQFQANLSYMASRRANAHSCRQMLQRKSPYFKVDIRNFSTAASAALSELRVPDEDEWTPNRIRIVLWVDAAVQTNQQAPKWTVRRKDRHVRKLKRTNSVGGVSVVYKSGYGPDDWVTQGSTVENLLLSDALEIVVIAQALNYAMLKFALFMDPGVDVVVYSSSKAALRRLRDFDAREKEEEHDKADSMLQKLAALTIEKAKELREREVRITLRYVSGHSQVPGIVLANKVARLAATKKT